LALNKRTIADLNNREMRYLKGGEATDVTCPTQITCDTCKPILCEPSLVCTGSPCQHTVELCETEQTTCQGLTCDTPHSCQC
jgi:hypothetical protein